MARLIKFRVGIHEVHVSYREVIAKEGMSENAIIKLAKEKIESEVSIEFSHTLEDGHTVERVGEVHRRGEL